MRTCYFAIAMLGPGAALAADPLPETVAVPVSVETRDIVIDLGLGAAIAPAFPSSEKYEVYPWPIARLRFLRLPVFGEVVTGRESAFTIYPAIGFEGERTSDDAAYLRGIPDTDFAFEGGAGAAVRYRFLRAFAEVRYGFTGHNGFVGEAGIDVVLDQDPRWELRVGPRISAASDDYMDEYFSVPNSALFLAPYDADGGIKDVGVEATAIYALTEAWRINATAEVTHFVGDALDSPIVDRGNDLEARVGIGLTYRFGLDLY